MGVPAGRAQGATWISRAWSGLLDLMFPRRCAVCETFSPQALCVACLQNLERIKGPICHLCGVPFDPQTHHGDLCPDCRGASPRRIHRVRSVCRYEGLARKAILEYKFHGRRGLFEPLGDLLWRYLAEGFKAGPTVDEYYTPPPGLSVGDIDLVVPVPLHLARQRERGFNQADLLVRVLCRDGLPTPEQPVLVRRRQTQPQMELSAGDRRKNVRGAFEVTQRDVVRDKTVLLVDDICTTCATLEECARMLTRAGAARVFGLTVARQLRK